MAIGTSPGVFTQEKDKGFTPIGIGDLGAAVVARSTKGPAFKPTVVDSFKNFDTMFGGVDSDYLATYMAKEYLKESGQMTFVRVLGSGTFEYDTVGELVSGSDLLAVIKPTSTAESTIDITVGGDEQTNSFDLIVSESDGETTYSNLSLLSTDNNYIGNVIGTNPKATSKSVYLEQVYYTLVSQSVADANTITAGSITSSTSATVSSDGYSEADSPTVISQTFSSTNYDLFELKTLNDGTSANTEIKVTIFDIKAASEIPNSDFGTFGLKVREFDDTDDNQVILETFTGLNLNPTSNNYIAKRIGDQRFTTDSEGRVTTYGENPNISEYIRVVMSDLEEVPDSAVPFGFKNMKKYNSNAQDPVYQLSQSIDSEYNKNACFGEDFTDTDNSNYHLIMPSNAANASTDFILSNCTDYGSGDWSGSITLNSNLSAKKFSFGFQNGFDGYDPRLAVASQSTFTTATSSGSVDYRKAIDCLSNPEEHIFNMFVTPEVNHREHSPVTDYGMDMCRTRGDAIYIVDMGPKGDSINTIISTANGVNNSYAATYYPWLKIKDEDNNKNVYVPPSVLMPAVFAYNDNVAQEWYAPAGLNRGGLNSAIDVNKRLYTSDRDELVSARINPIALFPNTPFPVAWAQNTLLSSANNKKLDKVNIRRLLIYAKRLISDAARYMLFEANNNQTWNRFKSVVNPILQDIKNLNGLYDFRVRMGLGETMSESDIDRNLMKGAIHIKPTEFADIISLDFNIMSTGATFPGEEE